MSNSSAKNRMDLTQIDMNEERPTKEKKVELKTFEEGSDGTIFDILRLPELDEGGDKVL